MRSYQQDPHVPWFRTCALHGPSATFHEKLAGSAAAASLISFRRESRKVPPLFHSEHVPSTLSILMSPPFPVTSRPDWAATSSSGRELHFMPKLVLLPPPGEQL